MVVNLLGHSYVLERGLVLFPNTKFSSIINYQISCLVLRNWRFKESAAWGHVGTWRSGAHCEGRGTACRLSPGLGGTKLFLVKTCRFTQIWIFEIIIYAQYNRYCSPMPPPPWGGAPNLKESMYALIFSKSVGSEIKITFEKPLKVQSSSRGCNSWQMPAEGDNYQFGEAWPFRSAAEHHEFAELQRGSPRPSWTYRKSWSISGW